MVTSHVNSIIYDKKLKDKIRKQKKKYDVLTEMDKKYISYCHKIESKTKLAYSFFALLVIVFLLYAI